MYAWAEPSLRFNTAPATYAHKTWWPELVNTLLNKIGGMADAKAKVWASARITEELGLRGLLALDFAAPERRIWLLDPRVLNHLAIEVGVAVRRDPVRKCVSRQQHEQMRSELGADAMAFALTQQAADIARVAAPPEPSESLPNLAECALIGAANLLSCIDMQCDVALGRRARLLFPRSPRIPRVQTVDASALMLLVMRRAAEVDPSCRLLLS